MNRLDANSPRERGRFAAPLLVLLAAVLLGGCYHYSAVDRSSLVAGQQVVLTLLGGSGEAERSGAAPVERIQGRVVSIVNDTIAVRTSRPATDRLRTGSTVVDTVRVPSRRVRSVRSKELQTGRTIGVAGGAALGLGIASALLLESVGGGSAAPGDGGGDGINRALSIP